MGKAIYTGVSSVARKGKKAYVGVGNLARKAKKVYIGDANGKARLAWSGGLRYMFSGNTNGLIVCSNENNFNSVTTLHTQASSTTNALWFAEKVNNEVLMGRATYLYKYNKATNSLTQLISPRVGTEVKDIAYGNGRYYVITYDRSSPTIYRTHYTSSLSINWSNHKEKYATNGSFSYVSYHNGSFYLLENSHNGSYILRMNATTLAEKQSQVIGDSDNKATGMIIFNGYIIVSRGTTIYYCPVDSSDMTWTTKHTGFELRSFVASDGRIFATGSESFYRTVYTSTDGINWTKISIKDVSSISTYGGALYFIKSGATNSSSIAYMSTDLTTSTQLSDQQAYAQTHKSFLVTELED